MQGVPIRARKRRERGEVLGVAELLDFGALALGEEVVEVQVRVALLPERGRERRRDRRAGARGRHRRVRRHLPRQRPGNAAARIDRHALRGLLPPKLLLRLLALVLGLDLGGHLLHTLVQHVLQLALPADLRAVGPGAPLALVHVELARVPGRVVEDLAVVLDREGRHDRHVADVLLVERELEQARGETERDGLPTAMQDFRAHHVGHRAEETPDKTRFGGSAVSA
mmetsp:Transcript_44749/g.106076  ORF Transcript_44749/g.106076 Transcript_44749/m.106076 type:complete len:226 (-) Transcript_44749:747-1424(-)